MKLKGPVPMDKAFQNPYQKYPMASLIFDDCLIDQEDRDIVANRVHTMTDAALQRVLLFIVCERLFADGTSENFE